MQDCFGRSDGHIEAPNFDPSFHKTSFGAGKAIALLKHLPWLLSIMLALPESIAMKMGEEVSANIKLKRVSNRDVSPVNSHLRGGTNQHPCRSVSHKSKIFGKLFSKKEERRTRTFSILFCSAVFPHRKKQPDAWPKRSFFSLGQGHTPHPGFLRWLLSTSSLIRPCCEDSKTSCAQFYRM